ncbi:peptidoglycan-binding protein, partial [Vibrio parahaemolyticus]|nr:peptidoglycan-binding protein [Vibrio parahaemolyticus]
MTASLHQFPFWFLLNRPRTRVMNRIFRNVASVTLPLLFSFNAVANVDA